MSGPLGSSVGGPPRDAWTATRKHRSGPQHDVLSDVQEPKAARQENCSLSVSLLGSTGSVTTISSPSTMTGGLASVSSLSVILSLYSCFFRRGAGFWIKMTPLEPDIDGRFSWYCWSSPKESRSSCKVMSGDTVLVNLPPPHTMQLSFFSYSNVC